MLSASNRHPSGDISVVELLWLTNWTQNLSTSTKLIYVFAHFQHRNCVDSVTITFKNLKITHQTNRGSLHTIWYFVNPWVSTRCWHCGKFALYWHQANEGSTFIDYNLIGEKQWPVSIEEMPKNLIFTTTMNSSTHWRWRNHTWTIHWRSGWKHQWCNWFADRISTRKD